MQVFVADDGASLTIRSAGQVVFTSEPVHNADGTLTYHSTYKGLPEKISVTGGRVLSRDAGTATITNTVRVLSDGSLELVSQTITGEHGPHPDLDGSLDFCAVVLPFLG